MSASPNLDLVRSIYAAWERGDFGSADWADPDIEFVIADGPSPGSWRGVSDMAAGHRHFLGAWDGFRTELEEVRELDADRVLVLSRYSGRGKTSGMELAKMQANGAGVAHIRDGKVTRLVSYLDRDRALADLGLAPEADASEASS